MCKSSTTRSSNVYIKIVDGTSSYDLNVTTFRNKMIQKLVVPDTTGRGMTKAPDASTLVASSVLANSYITLVGAYSTTDQIINTRPTSDFMPSVSSAIGTSTLNYEPVIFSGEMNFDIQNSKISFPDPTTLTGLAGQTILIEVEYRDYTAVEEQAMNNAK